MSAILSAGYNADFIDADAIEKVGLGHHSILVVPPTERIPLETLRKIAAFVRAGGKAIAVGRAPSIDPEGKALPELTSLSKQLFDAANSTLVADDTGLPAALEKAAKPDFQLASADDPFKNQLGFIRRKLPTADIYFVANTSNQPIDTTASFATKLQGRAGLGYRLCGCHSSIGQRASDPSRAVRVSGLHLQRHATRRQAGIAIRRQSYRRRFEFVVEGQLPRSRQIRR